MRIIRLGGRVAQPGETSRVIGRQLLRCGTSVGANYRSACRATVKADMLE
ncbi:MAG: four helix bundle protein [Chloroflexota bacterium]